MTDPTVYTTTSGEQPATVALTCRHCDTHLGYVEARYADDYRDTCGACEDWG
jgi:hypothetical protein